MADSGVMVTAENPEQFREPTASEFAGTMEVRHVRSPYERFMAAEGIPQYVQNGFHDVRELDLAPWDRYGARGAFLVCGATLDQLGISVLEIAPRATTEPVRHLYEQVHWVIEGRGTAEVWTEPNGPRQRFEWREGSFFAIPLNATYRLLNASTNRVLILAGNNAPPVIDAFQDEDFIFANPYAFRSRYNGEDDYFAPATETYGTPDLGRAMWRTSLIPDIVGNELPLDNQRSPGYRRIQPQMARGRFRCFVGEHVVGRYSKAHYHTSGAVLICVKGEGYTYNWPIEAGSTPWANGHGDAVERVDYVAGGMVAAAPGGGNWYHQHFGVGPHPLRLLVWSGSAGGSRTAQLIKAVARGSGLDESEVATRGVWLNQETGKGGHTVGYRDEDPHIRAEFIRALAERGGEFAMPADLYM
ncbi:MAG TPA: hypothetical protein VGJ28_00070 [Micromonosporaceae bacterium]|jgi:mannose-6-phosphate isomerase-like protein (cupin superfamily)